MNKFLLKFKLNQWGAKKRISQQAMKKRLSNQKIIFKKFKSKSSNKSKQNYKKKLQSLIINTRKKNNKCQNN